MPNWPARLSEDLAADYLGVSKTTLRSGAAKGRYPAPIRDGGRVLYPKCLLDRFVEAQAGLVANDQEGTGWGA